MHNFLNDYRARRGVVNAIEPNVDDPVSVPALDDDDENYNQSEGLASHLSEAFSDYLERVESQEIEE